MRRYVFWLWGLTCLLLLVFVLFDPMSYTLVGLPITLKPMPSVNYIRVFGFTAIQLKLYSVSGVVVVDTGWVHPLFPVGTIETPLKLGSYRWSVEARNLLGITVWSKHGVSDVVRADAVESRVFRI